MNLNYTDINGQFVFAQIIMVVFQSQGTDDSFLGYLKIMKMKISIENLNF